MAIMTIIIKAIDKASEVARNVGNVTSNQMNKIAQATDKARQSGDKFSGAVVKVGTSGQSAYNQLNNAQQQYINKVTTASGVLDRMGLSGTGAGRAILSGMDLAHNAVNRVKQGVETLKSKIESTTVGSKLITGWDTVKTKVGEVIEKVRTGLGNALETAKNKLGNLNQTLGQVGMAFSSAFGALGLGSITQATIGLALTREQMTALMTATMGSKDAAVDFIGTLDKMTNSSLVSLNDLGNAMSKIKMATGMTNEQLKLIAPTVNDIGQRAILMGKSTQEAQELMVAAFRGLNGEFDMLKSNFGITRQMLLDAGWSGAADDVEGYNTALSKVLENGGSMEEMLESTPGQIALVKKAFSTAGREIGEVFLPAIKQVLDFMLWLKEANPWVFKLVICIGGLVSAFALLLPVLGSVIGSFQSLLIFLGILKGAEDATTLSTIAHTVAEKARAISTKAGAVAMGIAATAQKLYAFATSGNVIATVQATIASIAYRVAQIAGAAATNAMAAAQWLLNAAMSANPVMIVVIAIIALVAILWHLYNTNETVRGAIDWLWSSLQQLGQYIWGGLIAAWNALSQALAPVGDALQQLGQAIVGRLIEAWNRLMQILAPVGEAFTKLWDAINGGASSGANDTFSQLWGILQGVYDIVVQAASVFWDTFGPAIMFVAGIVQDYFIAVFTTVWGILEGVIGFIASLISIFADLIAGNISVGEALSLVWEQVKLLFLNVFTSIMTGIGQFAIDLVQKGVGAAQSFLTGVVNWVGQLPGKMWNFLLSVIAHVLTWRNEMIEKAKDAGSKFVNGVIDFLKTLPGKAWSWLLSTINKIIQFASEAYNKARQAGQNIINAIQAILSSLPGKMYEWGKNAVNRFINAIIDSIPGVRSALNMISSLFPHSPPKEGPLSEITEEGMYEYGESLGKAFGQGVNNTTKDVFRNLDRIPTTPTVTPRVSSVEASPVTTTASMDTGGMEDGRKVTSEQFSMMEQTVGTSWNNMALATQTGLNTIQSSMASTLSSVVANNNLAYSQIQSKSSSTLTALVQDNQVKYNSIQNNMKQTLTNIQMDNAAKYASILNTTESTLSNLQIQTDNSMKQVTTSWENMKNSLISAAESIRSRTTSEINHLTSNIATFYRKIQNPILLLAGPMPARYKNRPSSRMMGSAGGPRIRSRPRGSFAGTPNSPLKSSNRNKTTGNNLRLLSSSPGIPCNIGDDCFYAGGWDVSDPHVKEIMRIIKAYRPHFGEFGNLGLTVGDFENSTWPVKNNLALFEALANKIVSGSRYDFYFNSNGLSPYQNALRGAYNCYDGALIMLRLASVLGLGGYMAHGRWGNVGHVWAVVGGKTFDTTAKQGGYGWSSPKVSSGPMPSSFKLPSFNDPGDNEPIRVEEDINLNISIDLANLPDDMDEERVVQILQDTITDKDVVNKLVKNRGFQDELGIQVKKTERRIRRANGS